MYPLFLWHAKKLLSENDLTITFVDVGSRNGILELESLAQFVNAYGFEPNPEEFQKLASGKTDASQFGIHSPTYRSIEYSPYALSDISGKQSLYVTRGPGATGLLPPDPSRLKEIHFFGNAFPKNFADDIFSVEKVIEVSVNTLKNFSKEKSLKYIDYLKIDVEGSEYEVLMGAGDLLENIGVIKAEVCFMPFRKGQKLFSEIDLLLRNRGFDLLKYEISPVQIGFKERLTSWSFGPTLGFPERFGTPLQADAVYVNRHIADRYRSIVQALILLDKNYLDEALFILKNKTSIEAPEFFELLQTYQGQWRTRLLDSIFRWGRLLLRPSPQKWK